MNVRALTILAIGLMAGPIDANAAAITRTYHYVAAEFEFTNTLLPPLAAPVDPWDLTVTVTFDPSVSSTAVNGVDSFSSADLNGGEYGPYLFFYDAGSKRLTIGDHKLCDTSASCISLTGRDAIFAIGVADPDNPTATGQSAIYRHPTTTNSYDFRSNSATVETVTAAPTPATVALIGIGLAGLGVAKRRKAQ